MADQAELEALAAEQEQPAGTIVVVAQPEGEDSEYGNSTADDLPVQQGGPNGNRRNSAAVEELEGEVATLRRALEQHQRQRERDERDLLNAAEQQEEEVVELRLECERLRRLQREAETLHMANVSQEQDLAQAAAATAELEQQLCDKQHTVRGLEADVEELHTRNDILVAANAQLEAEMAQREQQHEVALSVLQARLAASEDSFERLRQVVQENREAAVEMEFLKRQNLELRDALDEFHAQQSPSRKRFDDVSFDEELSQLGDSIARELPPDTTNQTMTDETPLAEQLAAARQPRVDRKPQTELELAKHNCRLLWQLAVIRLRTETLAKSLDQQVEENVALRQNNESLDVQLRTLGVAFERLKGFVDRDARAVASPSGKCSPHVTPTHTRSNSLGARARFSNWIGGGSSGNGGGNGSQSGSNPASGRASVEVPSPPTLSRSSSPLPTREEP
eukprot:m.4052 g.4052  ORF g.4052 m.4052 type:complete len:451 (+) comp2376_c0_seq1:115-1467(+)